MYAVSSGVLLPVRPLLYTSNACVAALQTRNPLCRHCLGSMIGPTLGLYVQ